MKDLLLQLSDEEMVAQGYLLIRRCGLMTSYIPTAKYRAAMHPTKELAIVLHSSQGIFDFDPEEVYHLCGECGENLYPRCACPSEVIVCPPPDVVVHRVLMLNPPIPREEE